MSTLSLFTETSETRILSTDSQNTPRDLAIDLGWFDLDPCSNPDSHILARRTCSLENGQDGLADLWTIDGTRDTAPASVFCNGNYSDPLPWCERLAQHSAPWAALWKLDPTTEWFRELTEARSQVWWAPFRKRLKFERAGNCGSADFPSVLVWRRWQPSKAVLARLLAPRSEA